MEEEAFQVRVRTLFEIIYKDGSRKIFNTREELLNEISQSLRNQKETKPIEPMPGDIIDSSKRKLGTLLRHIQLPNGYEEVFSEPSEKGSNQESVYRYAHNTHSDSWGYVVSNGKISAFHKLGSLSDRTSHLSRIYEHLPEVEGINKTGLYKFGWNGERAKAGLDVLKYLRKIEKKSFISASGRTKTIYRKLVEEREAVNSRGITTATSLPASQ